MSRGEVVTRLRGRRHSRRLDDDERSCAVAGTGTSPTAEAGADSIVDSEYRGAI